MRGSDGKRRNLRRILPVESGRNAGIKPKRVFPRQEALVGLSALRWVRSFLTFSVPCYTELAASVGTP